MAEIIILLLLTIPLFVMCGNPILTPIAFIKYFWLIKKDKLSLTPLAFKVDSRGYEILEFTSLIINPLLFFWAFDIFIYTRENPPCCDYGDAPILATEHLLTIKIIIIFSLICYVVAKYTRQILPPLLEILLQLGLFLGFGLNLLITLHLMNLPDFILIFFGNLPIFCLYTLRIIENHKRIVRNIALLNFAQQNPLNRFILSILQLKLWEQIPILILLVFPLLVLIISILLLFGQKPDSIILAFTETYKHTFSQLACNPNCPVYEDSHYLCTVASKGHSRLVKPTRIGFRRGNWIPVNQQLLIANAFEELLEKRFPHLHKAVRLVYDFIGIYIIQTHKTIQNPWVCDIVYILMKPLEWGFRLSLYLFYVHPENHIALQYLPKEVRERIKTIDNQQITHHTL